MIRVSQTYGYWIASPAENRCPDGLVCLTCETTFLQILEADGIAEVHQATRQSAPGGETAIGISKLHDNECEMDCVCQPSANLPLTRSLQTDLKRARTIIHAFASAVSITSNK
jgi:hypothetical protein